MPTNQQNQTELNSSASRSASPDSVGGEQTPRRQRPNREGAVPSDQQTSRRQRSGRMHTMQKHNTETNSLNHTAIDELYPLDMAPNMVRIRNVCLYKRVGFKPTRSDPSKIAIRLWRDAGVSSQRT